MNRSSSPLRRAITLALIASAASTAMPLTASAADEESLETVIVTGSNIRRADIETASPVQVVTREEIDRTGKTTLGDYLQTLTADGQGSVPKSFGTGFAAGAAGVSLRGLGAGSTLVLLNGRRIAPYGLADDGQKIFTDISVIPLEAVERVEVLKDGASAIYGSDAIAGVVNIILRQEVEGLTAKASFAASEEGDGDTSKISVTGGFGNLNNDGYNVYFNAEGSQSDNIRVSDRRGRKWIGTGDLRPWGYGSTNSQFLAGYIDGNTITNSPTGGVLTPGTNVPLSLPGCAQFSEVPQDGSGGGCLWESGRFRDLTPSQEYVNVLGRGTLRMSDNFDLSAELGYSRKKNEFNNTPSGVSGSWGYPGGLQNASAGAGATLLGATHPDNTLFPGQAVRVRYSAWDVGPRVGEQTNEFYRALVGLKGTIGNWDLDVAALHSESEMISERRGFLRYSAVREALSGTGPIVWRIGDNSDLNSQAVYDFISPTIHADGKSQLDSVDFKLSRGLFDLPGGEFGFAVGAEYRRLESSLTPQTYTDIGDIIGLGYSSFDGAQNSIGTYVEVLAPVLEELEISAAVRHDSYMNDANATTPKFGVKWSPSDMISFRGTYAEGFRIPNAAESNGIAAGFANARDPLRCPGGTAAPGASSGDCNASVAVVTRSNAPLEPEESESYTYGLVFSPLSSTTLTVDAWQINRTNEIRGETLLEVIARGDVIRNDNNLVGTPNSGTLLAANANYINAESTKVRGIDVGFNQSFDLSDLGRLNVDLQWSRINSYAAIQTDGSSIDYAGTHGNCDVTNCIGTPKNRINVGATWNMQTFSVSTVVNFRGEMRNSDAQGETCTN
ncbi:MAG TPA: TonB-dependent receptor, partial [Steroidobacteraceae bacterium]|nr:TonB-dependent receptor [Steroidobacteraceae bacterium]